MTSLSSTNLQPLPSSFAHALINEVAKMHRLWVFLISSLMVVVVSGMTSLSLLTNRGEHPSWGTVLMSYVFIAALVSPLLVGVLASRQVDIEHTGGGWNLAGGLGIDPGRLCQTKLVAVSGLLLIVVSVQTALIVLAGTLASATGPIDVVRWASFAACLWGVDVAFAAIHVWFAASFENQLIGLGVGLLGSFIAVYCALLPEWLARLIPWGYYAVISPVRVVEQSVVSATPPYGWLVGFLVFVGVGFATATSRMEVK